MNSLCGLRRCDASTNAVADACLQCRAGFARKLRIARGGLDLGAPAKLWEDKAMAPEGRTAAGQNLKVARESEAGIGSTTERGGLEAPS